MIDLTKAERNFLKRIEAGQHKYYVEYWQKKNATIFQSLVDKGTLNISNGFNCFLTPAGMLALDFVKCDGEAHTNHYIDHCMKCAPRWGWVKK